MALFAQLSEAPGALDFPFYNQQSSDIPAGMVVIVDSANALSASNLTDGVAVKLPGADGALVVGVTMEVLKANGVTAGRVRTGGVAKCTATGSITAGTAVMADFSGTPGNVKAQTSGLAQVGIALTTAASGESVDVLLMGGAKNA